MANNNFSSTYISLVEETTPGETPATPSMQKIRTSDPLGLNFNKAALESEEVLSHRQEGNVRHGLRSVGGSIPSELSYGAFNPLLEALLSSAFDVGVLKPANVLKTFTLEQRIGSDEFLIAKGATPSQLSITMNPNNLVQANWEFVGMDFESAGTSLGSPTDIATNDPFDGLGNAAITEGGSAIATVTSAEITINTNKTVGGLIGSAGGDVPTDGQIQIDGTITARFDGLSLFQKFQNETESALEITWDNPSGAGTLALLLPRIKYMTGQPQNNDGVVDISMGVKALYNTSDESAIVITET